MKYYAFNYSHSPKTTSGEPNQTTGCLNIAGDLAVFNSKSDRDEWVDRTYDRAALTLKQVRSHHLGMTVSDYNDYLEQIS